MTTSTEAGRKFVAYALSIGALELVPQGRVLKSGRLSPHFFNSGLFIRSIDLEHLGMAYAETIVSADDNDELMPGVIYGPAYKGIPLAVATAMMLRYEFVGYEEIGIAYNRKEAKDHGEGGVLIGSPLQDKRVVIADDVITDGASKREAVDTIHSHGGQSVACVIAFDRQERGKDVHDPRSAAQAFSEDYGIPVLAAATLDDLIQVLEEGPAVPLGAETLPLILAYRDQYGVATN